MATIETLYRLIIQLFILQQFMSKLNLQKKLYGHESEMPKYGPALGSLMKW